MKKIYFIFIMVSSLFPALVMGQYGYLDSTYANDGKQNYPDFNPYLYYDKGLTTIDQDENRFMLIGDILKTNNDDNVLLPIWKFVNDLRTAEVMGTLSYTKETFAIKCAVPFGGALTDKFLVGGSRNQDLFIKKFDSDGETDINFGSFGEVIMDLGGNDVVRSMQRLSNGSYLIFIKTTGMIACRKLKSDGSWDLIFGTNGQVDIPVIGDFNIVTAVNAEDEIFFTTGINRIMKMSKAGIIDATYNATANLYLDLTISHLLALNDGSLIISGNELITQQSLIMYKLNDEGAQDNAFGSFGKTVVRYNGKFNTISKVELFGSRLYCVGDIDQDMFLAKFTDNGIAVTTFGVDGKCIIEFGSSLSYGFDMRLSDNGKALLLGMRMDWLALARVVIAESPVITASSSIVDVCRGEPFQLFADGGVSYKWVGNDGFTSTEEDPIVTIDESFGGSSITYRVKGANADGFTGEAIVVVNIKQDIAVIYEEKLPCFGENSGHQVSILKNEYFDENTRVIFDPNKAQLVSEDNQSVTLEFNFANSPLKVTLNDTLGRYCSVDIEVLFRSNDQIIATLETTSIDSTCISVITPADESDPLSYAWSNGATTKIASGLPSGPFSVTVTNQRTGCAQSFEGECEPLLSNNQLIIDGRDLYPNPVLNELNIVGEGISEMYQIRIYDSRGQMIKSMKRSNDQIIKLNVTELQSGVYFLTILQQNGTTRTGKFVKN